jgi:hypothetical protein
MSDVPGWRLDGDRTTVGVTEQGGHLDPVSFRLGDRVVSPMHVAPWADEPPIPSLPPILQLLRGDFFCAPFSDSDVLADAEDRLPHGPSANAPWRLLSRGDDALELELDRTVMGARLRKRIELRPGHAAVYQRHTFLGGSGRLPVAHHAMLRVPETVYLGFSRYVWAGTPPGVVETPPNGRSHLAYPQRIDDLRSVELADGGRTDLTRYPTLERHEDLAMLISDPSLPFGWSTVSAPEHGWVWFAVKALDTLRGTTLWLSNGGRDYAPWSGRHSRVLGVEEGTTYFHLGHRASAEANPLSEAGHPTAIDLDPAGSVHTRYAFGVAAIPSSFRRVVQIEPIEGGLRLRDEGGLETETGFDLDFIIGDRSA